MAVRPQAAAGTVAPGSAPFPASPSAATPAGRDAGQLRPRQGSSRHAGHADPAVVVDDHVVHAGLEVGGRDLLGPGQHLLGGRRARRCPPICSDRDPPVPPPLGTAAVSDWTKRMSSIGMPSRSETIMANAVAWPWPWADVPTRMVAVPSRWISTDPNSLLPPPAVTST